MENMHPQPGHAAVARTSRMGAYSCVVTRRMGCLLYGVRLFTQPPGQLQSEIALELPAFAVIPDQFVDPAGLDLLAGRRQRSLAGCATAFVNVFFVTHKANVLA